jgi:hypothetical protein
VAHTCGSSYSGGGGRRIEVLGQARHSQHWDPTRKAN